MDIRLFAWKGFPSTPSYLAPDTSEIRILLDVPGAGTAHCTLPSHKVSRAVKHKTVYEIWYVLSGSGMIWQGLDRENNFAELQPGVSLTISPGNSFQFKNTGDDDLCILITTAPNWPGPDEAVLVEGYW